MRNGHAVDVVEAENRPISRFKGTRLTAAEQREKELLETEAFDELNISDDELADDQSSGNVTFRVSDGRTGSVPVISNKQQQGLPRWDARWPIDVWVSCGEPFVPLEGTFRLEQKVVSLQGLSTPEKFQWVHPFETIPKWEYSEQTMMAFFRNLFRFRNEQNTIPFIMLPKAE